MKNLRAELFLLLSIVLFCFIAPFLYGVSPYFFDKTSILQPPSIAHLFGTDRLGRDMLSRVMEGGKNSLIIGFFASSLSILISLKIGIWAGYYRGVVDKAITAFIDLFLTVPTFFCCLHWLHTWI